MKKKYIQLPREEWKDISGYEGLYQISKTGLVKFLSRKVERGNRPMNFKDHILKCSFDKDGYVIAKLSFKGKNKNKKVHRLIADAFIPKIINKENINHKNAVKNDNRVENLEWCTHQENIKHAVNNNLMSTNQKHDNKGRFCSI